MTYYYRARVGFEDNRASEPVSEKYDEALHRLGAIEIKDIRARTSDVLIRSKRELTVEELARIFGEDIPVLSLEKVA